MPLNVYSKVDKSSSEIFEKALLQKRFARYI